MDDLKEGMMPIIHGPEAGLVKVDDPAEHTGCEIAELVLRLPSGTGELVLELLPEDDPERRCSDICVPREGISRKLRIPVRAGLKPLGWFTKQCVREAS